MIRSLSPVTAGGGLSLPEQIALCARHDFQGLEISIEAAHTLGFETAKQLFIESNVVPVAFGLPVEWRKDDETFDKGLEKLPELAEFAAKLGVLNCCTWVLPDGGAPANEYSEISLERFTKIARIFAPLDIRLGLEFLGPKMFRKTENIWFYDIAGALQAADEINDQIGKTTVGLLIDCWHWYAGGGTLMDLASCPVEQMVHVHVNDAPKGVPIDDLIDNVRELPGATGEIDIEGFISTLSALGYEGAVSVETFSAELNALSADEAARKASEAMKKILG
jgi:sugar phosphate isomerase/epimerase